MEHLDDHERRIFLTQLRVIDWHIPSFIGYLKDVLCKAYKRLGEIDVQYMHFSYILFKHGAAGHWLTSGVH